MQSYIGTKLISAKPMSRLEYHQLRGWQLPADENGEDEGYLVEYLEGGQANVAGFAGYISWSPKAVFEGSYKPTNGMSFGLAVTAAEQGAAIARKGWNGAGQFVVYMSAMHLPPYNTQGTERKVNDRTAKWIGEDQPLDSQPYFSIYTAQKKWQPGWLPSVADIFATDWYIVKR